MAPSTCATTTAAREDTAGLHAVMSPPSLANRNTALPAGRVPLGRITNPVLLLNTCPVGAPPGMVTSSEVLTGVAPLTPPAYTVAVLVPLFATQSGPASGDSARPQALTSFGSTSGRGRPGPRSGSRPGTGGGAPRSRGSRAAG